MFGKKKQRKIDPVKEFIAAGCLLRNGFMSKTLYDKMVLDSMLKMNSKTKLKKRK